MAAEGISFAGPPCLVHPVRKEVCRRGWRGRLGTMVGHAGAGLRAGEVRAHVHAEGSAWAEGSARQGTDRQTRPGPGRRGAALAVLGF